MICTCKARWAPCDSYSPRERSEDDDPKKEIVVRCQDCGHGLACHVQRAERKKKRNFHL